MLRLQQEKWALNFIIIIVWVGCKERHRANLVNESFLALLKNIKVNPPSMKLYAAVLKDKLKQSQKSGKEGLEKLNKDLAKQNQRLKNARSLMLDGDISADEFKEMKSEIEENILKFNNEILMLTAGFDNYDKRIDECLDLLLNIDSYYVKRDTLTKQRIVSSIFPSKLIFENNKFRTPIMNKVVPLICRNGKGFQRG